MGRKVAGKSSLTPSPLGKPDVLVQRESPVQKRRVEDEDKKKSESSKKLKANDQESKADGCKKQKSGSAQQPKQSACDEKQKTECRKQKTNNRKQNSDCVKQDDSNDQVSPLSLKNHNKSCKTDQVKVSNVTNQSIVSIGICSF